MLAQWIWQSSESLWTDQTHTHFWEKKIWHCKYYTKQTHKQQQLHIHFFFFAEARSTTYSILLHWTHTYIRKFSTFLSTYIVVKMLHAFKMHENDIFTLNQYTQHVFPHGCKTKCFQSWTRFFCYSGFRAIQITFIYKSELRIILVISVQLWYQIVKSERATRAPDLKAGRV